MHWSILDPAGAGHTIHSINPDAEGKTKIVSRDLSVVNVSASVHRVRRELPHSDLNRTRGWGTCSCGVAAAKA